MSSLLEVDDVREQEDEPQQNDRDEIGTGSLRVASGTTEYDRKHIDPINCPTPCLTPM